MKGDTRLAVYLAVLGIIGAASFALPGTAGGVVRLSVGAAGVASLIGAVALRRPKRTVGWWLIALSGAFGYGAALAVAADRLGQGGRHGSVFEFVLTSLALFSFAAGLAVLGWRTVGRRGWDDLDAAITALGAFLIVWALYVDPALARSDSAFDALVATVVPAASLLVFAMGVKLAFGGAMSTWSGRLVLLASVAALCTSALLYFRPMESLAFPVGLTVAVAWLAKAILLGGAGVAADFVDVVGGHHRPAPDLPRWRLALFVVLATLAPLDVAVHMARGGTPETSLVGVLVPPTCASLILLLLVIRLALIARVAQAQAAELAHKSATLATAMAEQETLQRTLTYRALHDPLTGVGNRYVLTDRMNEMSSEPCRGQTLMMLDLDGFKDINDTMGHTIGDQLLVEVAQRLVNAMPQRAVSVRLGGDEFGVLLESTPADEARRTAEATVEALRSPLYVAGREVFFTASVGMVVTDVGARPPNASDGLRDADQALYAAKAAGGNRVVEFHPSLHDERLRRAQLTTELRQAVSRQDLMLHYQPVVELENGDVVGVEALARWQPAGGAMVAPFEFISLAEQTGLIVELGRWVLHQACHDAGPWYEQYGTMVGVNVSGRQLDDPAFADIVLETLAEVGLPGSALVLELTESSLIENIEDSTMRAQLDRLRDAGVRIAIDDFGTGYSSLSYITRLPVDAVKIDGSFTPNPAGSMAPHRSWSLVRAILQLISTLDLAAVAEGIETREQANIMRTLNCGYGQGYYFSPPMPADQITELLQLRARRFGGLGGRVDEGTGVGA